MRAITKTMKRALEMLESPGATLVRMEGGRWTFNGAPVVYYPDNNWIGTRTIERLLRAGLVKWTGSGKTGVRRDRLVQF